MKVDEVLNGDVLNVTIEDQKEVFEQMKSQKVFDLEDDKRENFINFICESDKELATDYLFHVLDEEIAYPVDDEKIKNLFSNEKMIELKNLMLEQLTEEDSVSEDDNSEEGDSEEE
jgi:hypothetical protein